MNYNNYNNYILPKNENTKLNKLNQNTENCKEIELNNYDYDYDYSIDINEDRINDKENNHYNKKIKPKKNYNNIKERFSLNINKIVNIENNTNSLKSIQISIIKDKFKNFIVIHRFEWLNKTLSISVHILIMIIFEIYFFFEYVVDIENETFINKIGDTFTHLETVKLNPIELEIIQQILENNHYIIENLYNEYIDSKKKQDIILHHLFIKSCKITLPFGIICFILLLISICNFRYIKWKTIVVENIIMFLVLGLFEYYFFLNIILKYEPVTNEEIKYFMVNHFNLYLSRIKNENENEN
jgi:hypothetical protein